MSPTEQRIAIATACGWRFLGDAISKSPDLYEGTMIADAWLKKGQEWDTWEVWEQREIGYEQHPPDYLNDLNACNEMEKVLTDEQYLVFRSHVADLCAEGIEVDRLGNDLRPVRVISATAAQRCESFLRTLNLWRPADGKAMG